MESLPVGDPALGARSSAPAAGNTVGDTTVPLVAVLGAVTMVTAFLAGIQAASFSGGQGLALAAGCGAVLGVVTAPTGVRVGHLAVTVCGVFAIARISQATGIASVLTVAAETLALAVVVVGARSAHEKGRPTALDDVQLSRAIGRRQFERELLRSRRIERPLSVIVVAPVTPAGGRALPQLGARARRHEATSRRAARRRVALVAARDLRRIDSVMLRPGSVGIVLVCPETPLSGAESAAARIRRSMERQLRLRVACGASSFPEDGSALDELIAQADRRRSTDLSVVGGPAPEGGG